jgi:hypothetical protein
LKDEQSEIIRALKEGGFEPFKPEPTEGIIVSNAIEDKPKEQESEAEAKPASLPNGRSLVWSA